jgi:hypothetical protein
MAELQAHVALVPMVRIGAYIAGDLAKIPGAGTRTFLGGGLHAKITPPLLAAPWRAWAFVGLGYSYAYATSYHTTVPVMGEPPADVLFGGISGGILEIPLGFDLGYKLAPNWLLFAELGGRFGVGFFGSIYEDGATGSLPNLPTVVAPFMGKDSFGLALSVGVSFDK